MMINTDEPFLLVDTNMEVITFSKKFKNYYLKYFGIDFLKGTCVLDYAQPARIEIVKKIYADVFNGASVENQIEVPFPNNTFITFLTKYKPALNEAGEIIGALVSSVDITQKIEAEEKQKINDKRFAALIEHASEIISLTDKNGDVIYVSPCIERITGFKPKEIIDKTCFLQMHPDQAEESKAVLQELLQNPGVPIQRTNRFLHKNGEYICVEGTVINLLNDPSVRAIVSNYREITEKIKVEQALKLSERLFKALVQDGADLIGILDLEGNYKFISPSAATIVGVEAHKLIGKNAFDYIHKEDKQRVFNQFNLLKRKKRVQISPFRFKNANNNWIWLETIATNMLDDPAVQGIVSNSRDITLNVNYNQKLKQNFERYESLAKATSDAIWDHDFEINKTYIAGEGYRNLFGYNLANQFSENLFWESKLHPEEKETILVQLNKTIQDPLITQSELEYRFLKADGSYAHVRDRFFIIRENGKPLRMLGAKQDVTNQKIEEQEKEKLITELIQNNKDLKQFSYITSHNLRGPIASLLGLSSLLDNYAIKDPTLKQILAGIKKATHMFDDIIKDLTKVLNIKDHISIPQEDLMIASALEKGIAQNETMILEIGAQIDSQFNNALTVKFNKAYLESIFFNLISNAIKYRSPSRALKIVITSEIINDDVILKFSDNGLGLNVELYKERLFRLYQRFHDHAEGKGLGLFLIKSQMEALNGSIDIESTVGVGATFILKFKK
ncbi:MAG: PAS domain S-box protein [Bacteroidetes bacterium]|nr:PAS domain S-box protein [Bacteroidota bacterium]